MGEYRITIPATAPVPPVVQSGKANPAAKSADRTANASSGTPASSAVREKAEIDLDRFARELERYLPKQMPNTRLQIVQDGESGIFVYKSIDRESGEVVRQYPADEVLRFISYYREREGLVVDGSV